MDKNQDARIAELLAQVNEYKRRAEAAEAARTPTTGPFVRLTDKGQITIKPSDTFDAWPVTLDLDQVEALIAYVPAVTRFLAGLDRSKCRTADQRKAARDAKKASQ